MSTTPHVTQQELPFPKGTTLMSTTDSSSYLQYANESFVQVSGYTREELMGQAHNIVRHPDMPKAAFADMWATIKSGKAWTGIVKNRCKNGNHYWVRANAIHMVRQGQPVGYISVRTEPSRQEVQAAETLYAQWQAGQNQGWGLREGVLVRRGLLSFLTWGRTLSTPARATLGALAGSVVTGGALLGGLALAGALPALSLTALGAAAGAALAGTAVASLWLRHHITAPLDTVLQQAQRVAGGDPQNAPGMDRIDAIGHLQRCINQSGLNLKALVDDIASQTSGLTAVSREISSSSHDLSQRSERQASNLQQTASAMDEITGTVRSSGDSASAASRLAEEARQITETGEEAVQQVVHTMQDISASSKRINDIIGVIDSIAFQTNILALNASVEAARAGEQGRGFAVVASEVRNLAQRSAGAAKEIKQLIVTSVQTVDSGNTKVGNAGQTMSSIKTQVSRVSDLIAQISTATQEQSQGIDLVNQSVVDLDNMTQQNVALVEESAAVAQQLHHQASVLQSAIAVFGGQVQASAPAAPARQATPQHTAQRAIQNASRSASQSKPASPARATARSH
ncbi:methyl-accepting chemotaxis protein [Amphibiibacter pelophylacis]|uniref:Methyl-accepting chemotaxis protein n=1 Tax=Amphibiibacter pelophylacis TaxID=1799477 RepID=A0ACC6P5C3_9BURK